MVQNTLSADLRQNTNQSSATWHRYQRPSSWLRLDKIDKDITDLDGKLTEFQNLDPSIIVSPFRSEVKNVAKIQLTILDFFRSGGAGVLTPASGSHLCRPYPSFVNAMWGPWSFSAFHPFRQAEALFGKFISYMIFGGVIAAILSALLVFTLHVPMLGNWWNFSPGHMPRSFLPP